MTEQGRIPIVVSFGGGVNSTALLVGMYERGKRPDAILFADTGGERTTVYDHAAKTRQWCLSVDFPEVTVVRYDSRHKTLEQECINNETLPSLVFGNRGCSVKWKRQPMDKWVRDWTVAIDAWNLGLPVARYLGIHAGEPHRGIVENDDEFIYDRPLIRWGWGQQECEAACLRIFGYIPDKSACFYCPAMKKREVLRLAKSEPDLLRRAIALEHNARLKLSRVKGLGRHWSWEDVVAADERQLKMFEEPDDMPCLCE